MMDSGFIAVPLISFLCNAFLFVTVASAKRSKTNGAFLLLLGSFSLWTGGSLFMRLALYPGMQFWYDISALGVFATPFCIYNFLYYFTNRKGTFARTVWLVVWAAIIVLNQMGVFIRNPQVITVNGVSNFMFSLTWYAAIPILAALLTLLCSARMIYRSIRRDGIPASAFRPLLIGCAVMFAGILVQSVFGIDGLSSDTLFCGINAVCLYYALYKKRLLTLMPLTSNGPVYFMAVTFTMLIMLSFFPKIDAFYSKNFSDYESGKTFVYALLFSLTTLVAATLLHHLMKKLFIEGREAQEQELRQFSYDVGKSLDTGEVVETYLQFLRANATAEYAYICMRDAAGECYGVAGCTRDVQAKEFSMASGGPLEQWLVRNGHAVRYAEFCRTREYKAMWESEKDALRALSAELILPVISDGRLIAVTFFIAKAKNKPFSFREIGFMESAAAILAIALKNAALYAEMQNEARRDALTGLFNRSYFLRHIRQDFEASRHDKLSLLIISFDDFRLYNELYTSYEGDAVLRAFGRILEKTVNGRGMVARYGGKEFAVSLPFSDPRTAEAVAEECRALMNRYLASSGEKTKKFLTFSAGICGYPTAAANVDELVSFASIAVYSAKKNGKNRTVIYAGDAANAAVQKDAEAAKLREERDNCTQTILALTAAIDAKDHYTFDHSNNVSKYASQLAAAIGLDQEHVEMIRQAGLLHDIGKIGIPEAILTKQGRLTEEEHKVMQQHVEGSIAMIRYLPSLDYVIPAAIGHHERWDGKGYPRGIAGEEIPVGARCLCIADAFDAMTTARSYRLPMPVEAALDEIERCLGTQFDPVLGRKFIELVRTGGIAVARRRTDACPKQSQ